MLTNKYDLPGTIVRATHKGRGDYNKGNVHRSATQLLQSPRIDLLRKRHYGAIHADVTDEIWSLLGTAVHHILQMGAAPDQVVEERLYAELDGWHISGAIDVQNITKSGIEIEDYKVTSCYQITANDHDAKDEWVQQVNIYRWLIETVKGIQVNKASIIVILRDWQRSQTGDPNYPIAPIIRIDVPLWPMPEIEAFIRKRIRVHRQAELMADLDIDLPLCSVEDRWGRGGLWKVYKIGGKRAIKTHDTMDQADAHQAELGSNYEVRQTAYKFVRCEGNYCSVSQWCSQWQKERGQIDQKQTQENEGAQDQGHLEQTA